MFDNIKLERKLKALQLFCISRTQVAVVIVGKQLYLFNNFLVFVSAHNDPRLKMTENNHNFILN